MFLVQSMQIYIFIYSRNVNIFIRMILCKIQTLILDLSSVGHFLYREILPTSQLGNKHTS